MTDQQKLIVNFADTGIGTVVDDIERDALVAGTRHTFIKINIRKSAKYGEYAVFDTLDDRHYYTTSTVIVSQAKSLLDSFSTPGDFSGELTADIIANVVERKSLTTGRLYLSLE